MSRIRPIRGNLLVEPPAKESVTKGGIYIPETSDANAKGLTKGKIIDMSDECNCRKYGFAIGKTVIFNKFAYTEIKVPATEVGQLDRVLFLINQDKVEAVIE
jgi:co-chaperonin GroES (HSP10)